VLLVEDEPTILADRPDYAATLRLSSAGRQAPSEAVRIAEEQSAASRAKSIY
jgi:hypothetical protein